MKKFLASILVGCMVLAFASCGTTPPATTSTPSTAPTESVPPVDDEVTIGVLIYKFDDTYISTVRQAIESYAASAAVKVTLAMQDGKGDQAAQNDQMDVLCQQKVNAILINAVDAGAAQGLADKAKAANIPAIFFNREPDKAVVESCGGLFVGTTASEAGVMQGDILAELWASDKKYDLNGDGKCQYLVFKGEPGNPEAEARTKFCVDQAVAKGVQMENLEKEPIVANWATAEAQSAMEAKIPAHKDKIEAVFCNNDDMALGVIAALQSAGYNKGGQEDGKWIPVIGVDATAAGMEAISNKTMFGTVKQDGDAMGKALVALAVNAATGAASPYTEGTEYTLAADGFSVRIPYAPVK